MSMEQILSDLIKLTGYTDADAQLLQETSAQTLLWETAIAKMFYDTVFGYEPTESVFREGERPVREKSFMHWYGFVVQGKIDENFWRWQWYVGLIHIPRGISNAFMLGMMSKVQQLFAAQCMQEFGAEKGLQVFGAFKRVTDVIAGLIAEGYFESYLTAVENATGQSRKLIDRQVSFAVEEMVAEAQKDRL